jgi:hypothetical protein
VPSFSSSCSFGTVGLKALTWWPFLQLPLLRKLALDLCDACEEGYDSPNVSTENISICNFDKTDANISLYFVECGRKDD